MQLNFKNKAAKQVLWIGLVGVCSGFPMERAFSQTPVKIKIKEQKRKDADKALKESLEKRLVPDAEMREKLYGGSLERNQRQIDRAASSIRKESISTILNVLNKTKDVNRKYELMRRLVDMYLEQGQYVEAIEMRKYDAQYKKWERVKKRNKNAKEPELDQSKSKKIYLQAEKVLRVIIRDYLKRPQTAYSLLDLGDLLARKKDPKAPEQYKTVVKIHKNSPMLSEAYLSLGEYYFDRAKWKDALGWYQKLLKLRQDKYYPYAAYKLGWVYYNFPTKDPAEQKKIFAKSATAFKLVIKYADKAKKVQTKRAGALKELREDSINDLVMVWADAEDSQSAYEYFRKIGNLEKYYIVLERMAAAYIDNGKTDKAIEMLEKLLKEAPLRKSNPKLHADLVEQYEQKLKVKKMYQNLNKMAKLYVDPKSRWHQKFKDEEEILKDGLDKIEFSMRYWSTSYHKQASQGKRKNMLNFASLTYALYLKYFEKHPNAYEMRFYYADTLDLRKKHLESGNQYFKVVNLNRKNGRYLKEASINAVAQYFEAVKQKKFAKLPKLGTIKKPVDIPTEKSLLVKSIDSHVKLFPKEKDIPFFRKEAADIFYKYGHYKKAIERYTLIARRHPKTKQADASVKIVIGYYNLNTDWLPLIATAKKYLKFKGLPKKLRAFVRANLITASYKYAQELEKQKKYKESADRFVAFYNDFTKDPNASRALYNASMNYRIAKDYNNFFKYGKLLFDKFPKFKFLDQLVLNMAQTYEGIADYSNAARYYDLYSRRWTKSPKAIGAMYNASVLYAGLKFYEQASKIVSLMAQKFPGNTLTKQAQADLPALYEQSGDYAQAISLYQTSYNARANKLDEKSLEMKAKILILNQKKSGGRLNEQYYKSLLADLKRSKQGIAARKIAAKIMFDRIKPMQDQYDKMRIRGDKNMDADLEKKNNKLVQLSAEYEKVIAVGHPEYHIASLIRIGDASVEFSRALLATPVDGMTGSNQQIFEYFKNFQDAAQRLMLQGIDYYKAAHKTAVDLDYVSNWTNRSFETLANYYPDQFGSIKKPYLEFQYKHVN